MAAHGSMSRRRLYAGVLAPGALGLAAVVALAWPQPEPPRAADPALVSMVSTADCKDMVSISIGGRGDTPRSGQHRMLVTPDGTVLPAASGEYYRSDWVAPVVDAPTGAVGEDSYAAVYIEYPAHMASYEDAVTAGVDNTATTIRAIQASCPDTQFAIVGYSEGADVARRAAQQIGHQQRNADGSYDIVDPNAVTGVVILADAGRTAGSGPFPGADDEFRNPDGFDTPYQSGQGSAPGAGALPDTSGGFGALDGRVASFCSEGDLTCSTPENIALLQLAINVGRQLNIDGLQRDGLTPETGANVAQVLAGVALAALADIDSQENWMQSDETFLDVLIKVSDPSYVPNTAPANTVSATDPDAANRPIPSTELANLAYLPEKLFKEVVGFIEDNQNTLAVVLSDPYQQTLAPGTGHHFDYWKDADPANGKPLTSAEYAGAWLTHLAERAKNGERIETDVDPQTAKLAVAGEGSATTTTEQSASTPSTTPLSESATTPAPVTATDAAAPVPGEAPGTPGSAAVNPGTAAETSGDAPVPGEAVTTDGAGAPDAPPATDTGAADAGASNAGGTDAGGTDAGVPTGTTAPAAPTTSPRPAA